MLAHMPAGSLGRVLEMMRLFSIVVKPDIRDDSRLLRQCHAAHQQPRFTDRRAY